MGCAALRIYVGSWEQWEMQLSCVATTGQKVQPAPWAGHLPGPLSGASLVALFWASVIALLRLATAGARQGLNGIIACTPLHGQNAVLASDVWWTFLTQRLGLGA